VDPRPVMITWKDITSMGDWNEPPDSLSLEPIKTVGFLVGASPEEVVLAGPYMIEDGEYAYYDHTTFPSGCVSRIVELSDMPSVRDENRVSPLQSEMPFMQESDG